MSWILVVLQVTSMAAVHRWEGERYGWATIGEFQTEQACIVASTKLAQASRKPGVSNFQCLKKD